MEARSCNFGDGSSKVVVFQDEHKLSAADAWRCTLEFSSHHYACTDRLVDCVDLES